MVINKRSLGYKLILPSLIIVFGVFILLFLLITKISHTIQEDYLRFTLGATGAEVSSVLSSAASDLTSAGLAGNQVVVETKQKSVCDAIVSIWKLKHYEGMIIASDRSLVLSTLPQELAREIAGRGAGLFPVNSKEGSYYFHAELFPLWGWTVVTATHQTDSLMDRSSTAFLIPLVAAGCLLMALGIYLVIRRNIQRPVKQMASEVARGETVSGTGLAELDIIGSAVNDSMGRLKERSLILENELSERRRMEQELRAKDLHIRSLLSSTEEGIYGVDMHGLCTFCNASFLMLLGYDREDELLGANVHDLIHHSYPDGSPYPAGDCKAYAAFFNQDKSHVQDEVFWRRDGSSIPVEYWAHPILEDGRVSGAVVTFIDISQRRSLEEQLFQSQKMEAIGLLAGGIAHDFNNLLMAITGYGELLQRKLGADPVLGKYVDNILSSGHRGAELTRGLLAFSRKQVLDPKPADLNTIISDMEKILRRIITEDVVLTTMLMQKELVIMADRSQIDQVLMNLVTNARDAMTTGGNISVSTGLFHADSYFIQAHKGLAPGNYACLTVSDTGNGMDAATREKIFEPFFTTKGVGKGTGLGLSIVYGIVSQHHGFINVYSETGKGTVIKVYFPLCEKDAPAPEQQLPLRGGNETILIAEDEEVVRSVCKTIAEDFGYRIIEAKNGAEAAALFSQHADEINLLLLDIIMPVQNGREAWDEINRIRPGIKTVFMSGYTDDIISRQGIEECGLEFIEKPVSSELLLRTLRSVLDR